MVAAVAAVVAPVRGTAAAGAAAAIPAVLAVAGRRERSGVSERVCFLRILLQGALCSAASGSKTRKQRLRGKRLSA